MDKLYTITNTSKVPLYVPWNTSNMTNEMLTEWQKFKENEKEELAKMSMEQRIRYMKTPESTKIDDWATTKGYGNDPVADGSRPYSPGYRPTYKLRINPGKNDGFLKRQVDDLKHLVKKSIEQKLKPGEITPKIQHEGYLEITEMVENDKFVCEHCKKEFETKLALIGHSKTHGTK